MKQTIKIADIKLDAEIYPRDGHDDDNVALCRLGIDRLPPIVITTENWLVDGYHRYLAHVAEGRHEIDAQVVEIAKDDILREALRLNAAHGKQLSKTDKRKNARALFGRMDIDEIADRLSVGKRTVEEWTRELRAAEDEQRNERIWQAWLACKSTEEIEKSEGESHQTIGRVVQKRKTAQMANTPPDSLQLFNHWSFHDAAKEYGNANYPGRIPGQIVENLLWYYTEPGDVVLDPMAGGGTTIDVCKAMGRRYLAYDLRPSRPDIAQHDARQPIPVPESIVKARLAVKLVVLDPPYWKQKQGDYEPGGLADDDLETFYESMLSVMENAAATVNGNGHLALIIGPTQEGGVIHDHAATLIRLIADRYDLVNRIIVPYTTQQAKGYHVTDAKQGRYMLKLYRDLLISRKRPMS